MAGQAIQAPDGMCFSATSVCEGREPVAAVGDGPEMVECALPWIHLNPWTQTLSAAVAGVRTTHSIDDVRDIARFATGSGGCTRSGGSSTQPAEWGSMGDVTDGEVALT